MVGNLTTAPTTPPTIKSGEMNELILTTAGSGPLIPVVWTNEHIKILGGVLWCVLLVILVGNISCFYAVYKNLRKILEHPFFQSNVLCIYLSIVDIVLVVFVGIPAAVAYSTLDISLTDGYYNVRIVNEILDYLVWLQLILITGICVDRAGHIARPLTYTFGLSTTKTVIACSVSTILPFILLLVPKIVALETDGQLDSHQHTCIRVKNVTDNRLLNRVFLGCMYQIPTISKYGKILQYWETTIEILVLVVAAASLITSNCIIVVKLLQSIRLQKQRKHQVEKSIKTNSLVTLAQLVLVLISTVPYRHYTFHRRFFNNYVFHEYHLLTVRVLVFFGPMFNPWLYPIRMASIRTFLVNKRKTLVISMSTSIMKLRSAHSSVPHQPLNQDDSRRTPPSRSSTRNNRTMVTTTGYTLQTTPLSTHKPIPV